TAGSAAVVGRSGTLAGNAARIAPARCRLEDVLEHDPVLPAIAEIVRVLQRRVGEGQYVRHAVLPPGSEQAVAGFVQRDAKAQVVAAVAATEELMQVGVVPGERALDGDVQIPERAVARHLDAAPDQRLD